MLPLSDASPLSRDQADHLNQLLPTLTPEQLTWLSGYLAGLLAAHRAGSGTPAAALQTAAGTPAAAAPRPKVHIAYGTESGNAEALADTTASQLKSRGYQAEVSNLADLQPDQLPAMSPLLVIVSTWGDGDPPDAVVDFHAALMDDDAPSLDGLEFAVCALGDTSYTQFCQTGKDFDRRLEELGGRRLADREDCDLDFEQPWQVWLDRVTAALAQRAPTAAAPASTPAMAAVAAPSAFGKGHPFPAPVVNRVLLSAPGSHKETWHFELSLENSGLSYEPGDALAMIPRNAPDVVEAVIAAGRLNPDATVPLPGGGEAPLHTALTSHYDITTLSKPLLEKYAAATRRDDLQQLIGANGALPEYLDGRQLIDLLADYPHEGALAESNLVALLRRLPARLYSIASSPRAHQGEVHLTVAAVRYQSHGRPRKGVCSTYLADLVKKGDTTPVYIHPNNHFRPPADPSVPLIMVGPGTGVAPFRAFVEDRAASGVQGRSWLFFGDQRYSFDFLYQLEWQQHLKNGHLTRLDVAFSRDQPEKVYVQHRLRERARELFAWLEEGACFYVCGDATRMAPDVHEALIDVVQTGGDRPREAAEAYVDALRQSKRYLRDVY